MIRPNTPTDQSAEEVEISIPSEPVEIAVNLPEMSQALERRYMSNSEDGLGSGSSEGHIYVIN